MTVEPESGAPVVAAATGRSKFKRWLPLALFAVAIGLAFAFDLDEAISFDALRNNRVALTDFVAEHSLLAVLCFVATYCVATALSFPGASLFTVGGGFLFGGVVGCLWSVVGATLGAIVIFLVARSAFGDVLEARAGPFLKKMEAGFRENALSYLLFLRLVPAFPFFIVNLVPAFLGVSLRDYAIATFLGIIPGGFVYASVGAGLGSYFDANEAPNLNGILTPEIIVALVGLGLLSLLPIVIKRFRRGPSKAI